MDDIYDWSSKFAERVDDLEEVNSAPTILFKLKVPTEYFFPFPVHVG